jgi:hypothetical protein
MSTVIPTLLIAADSTIMEGDIKILNSIQLEEKIKLLENSYAELIADEKIDKAILIQVWKRIKEVRLELQRRIGGSTQKLSE